MGASSLVAQSVSILCLGWIVLFVTFGSTPSMNNFYIRLIQMLAPGVDNKDAIPILCLGLPILLAGNVCSLLLVAPRRNTVHRQPYNQRNPYRKTTVERIQARVRIFFEGDVNMNRVAATFLGLPLLLCVIARTREHLLSSQKDISMHRLWNSLANALGTTSVVAMSILLLPVARHSPILKLFNWSPAAAVQLHKWTGRIVVFAGVFHGLFHLYRMKMHNNIQMKDKIILSASCFNQLSQDHDEACYKQLRNFTGIAAALGLVVIALTSLDTVRRSWYTLFYSSHIFAGPLVLVSVLLHWRRSVLYLSGGLLYYLATTLAVYYETQSTLKKNANDAGGVRILSAERIPGDKQSCVALTVEVDTCAIERYRPGQYVKILAPEISMVSHPFTINICQRHNHDKEVNVSRMQVIFRETGFFTNKLGSRLLDEAGEFPRIAVDGFYGSSNRLQVALTHHDMVVMVAGGVGITPYLSILHQFADEVTSFHPSLRTRAYKTRSIILHWICRDDALVDFVQREYFEPLVQRCKNASRGMFRVTVVVHRTSAALSQLNQRCYRDDEGMIITSTVRTASERERRRAPFRPSKFAAAGTKMNIASNLPLFASFTLIGWLGLCIIWQCYSKLQEKDQLLSRCWSTVALVTILPLLAKMTNACFTKAWEDSVETDDIWPDSSSFAILSDVDFSSSSSTMSCTDSETDSEEESAHDESIRTTASADRDDLGFITDGRIDCCDTCLANTTTVVTVSEREGRPKVQELINELDGAHMPVLYTCGPSKLLQDIRRALMGRRTTRLRPHITYYEESFEM